MPKPNELGVYSALPHLYCPVITEPSKAAGVTRWIYNEAEQRYARLSKMRCRTVEQYNTLVEAEDKLPRIVVIIDGVELLQLGYGDYEDTLYGALCRCHEVGIHFVITVSHLGFNTFSLRCQSAIPNRVSFRTVTTRQSRAGIGVEGAERLAGIGKCLLATIFTPGPVELQAYKVEQDEIDNVMYYFTSKQTEIHGNADLLESIPDLKATTAQDNGKQEDDLLPDAVRIVMDSGSASISMIQRRLRIGYARSARLVDIMEHMNIVSGFDGEKPRKVLIDEAGYRALFSNNESSEESRQSDTSDIVADGKQNDVESESAKTIKPSKTVQKRARKNNGANNVSPAERRITELTGMISELNTQKDLLGLFKWKEKKRLQEQIDQATAELESIRSQFRV